MTRTTYVFKYASNILISLFLCCAFSAQGRVISPEQFLSEPLGKRHLRFDQVQQYLQQVDQGSDKAKLITMGESHEKRKLSMLAISSSDNIKRLDELRLKHLQISNPKAARPPLTKMPIFIWLSYSIHGDESSGTHAAVQLIYDVLSNPEADKELANVVLFIEPIANPDGYARFSTWANSQNSLVPVSDPQHIEHQQTWLTGRGNHYLFDLNRDWLALTQPESQARVKYYHYYQPNVFADFHEMDHQQSYFFQPGVSSNVNILTPPSNQKLTKKLTQAVANAFDQAGKLYFTQERFDDYFYGKGSSYPDIQGGIGLLFEQGAVKGQVIESTNAIMTFEQAIKNQLIASKSLIQRSVEQRNELLSYQRDFYINAKKFAKEDSINGYLVHEPDDPSKLNAFLHVLKQHQIKAYQLAEPYKKNNHNFQKEATYWIPLQQAQYKLIKSLFSRQSSSADKSYYDVSNWNLALAYGIETLTIKSRFHGIKIVKSPWSQSANKYYDNDLNYLDYAWVLDWKNSNSHKIASQLLTQNFQLKLALEPFSAQVNNKIVKFDQGSLVILPSLQSSAQNAVSALNKLQAQYPIKINRLQSGTTLSGADLGSLKYKSLSPVSVAILVGDNINLSEVGEIWHYIDTQLKLPLTKLYANKLDQYDLSNYTHLVLVDGQYSKFMTTELQSKISHWVKLGGTLLAQKSAAAWTKQAQFIQNDFLNSSDVRSYFDNNDLAFKDKQKLKNRMRISGTNINIKVDRSHPLSFGVQKRVPVLKNKQLVMEKSPTPFEDVYTYPDQLVKAGHLSKGNRRLLANTAGLTTRKQGKGLTIAWTDNWLFRGYWKGTEPLFANSLLLSETIKD